MSSAAIRGCSAGAATVALSPAAAAARARSARPARAAGGRSSCRERASRSGRCRGRAGRSTCRAWRIWSARLRAASSPSGSATVSPDWKLRSQRRPPTQVAEASCGFSVGTAAIRRLELLAPGRWRRGRSAAAGRASCRPARGRARRPRCRSAPAGRWLCHSAAGVRSTMSMTSVSGRRRDTRASLTQPNRSRRWRIATTSTSACGALLAAGLVGGAVQLIGDDRVDRGRGPCG